MNHLGFGTTYVQGIHHVQDTCAFPPDFLTVRARSGNFAGILIPEFRLGTIAEAIPIAVCECGYRPLLWLRLWTQFHRAASTCSRGTH